MATPETSKLHPLIIRQIRKHLGQESQVIENLPPQVQKLIVAVSEAYLASDADRELSERALDVVSQDLVERNQSVWQKNEDLEAAKENLRRAYDELEMRVGERTKALRRAMEEAEAANSAKSEFLANMSHEIRTPMTAILAYADMLLAPEVDDAQRQDFVQTLRRQGEHLLNILNDILDISKIEANKLEVECIPCDPRHIISDAMSLIRVRAVEKKLMCEVTYAGQIPQQIKTDPTRLRQILINLVGNAIKFTEMGGVQVCVSLDQSGSAASQLRIEVVDSGIGMTAEQLSGLFKPFAQADGSMTRRFGGTGLGLSICKRLSQMLGGDISVQSRPGCGSRFIATIATGDLAGVKMSAQSDEAIGDPVHSQTGQHQSNTLQPTATADATAPAQPDPSTPPAKDVASSHAPVNTSSPPVADPNAIPKLGGHVLLAEDGVHNQRAFKFYIEATGARISIVENGRVAMDRALQALANGKPYDVILMDMQMPEMDGYQATTQLRLKGYKGPIVAVTAHAMSGDRRKCMSAGCDEYLTKPLERHRLHEILGMFLPNANAVAPTAVSTTEHRTAEQVPAAATVSDPPLRPTQIDPGLATFLPAYIIDLADQVRQLHEALDIANTESICTILHGLKGTGGLYGFPPISQGAAEAEQVVLESGLEKAQNSIQALLKLIQRVDGYGKPADSSTHAA